MESRFRPYEISLERVDEVAMAFEEVGLDGVFKVEAKLDPQYPHVRGLSRTVGEQAGVVYSMLVALVSYRLAMRGEDWWKCFNEMLGNRWKERGGGGLSDVINDVIWFLTTCPGASIRRDAKIKRIRTVRYKARRLLERIYSDPEIVLRDPAMVAERIARALQVEVWRKTVVFSLKMGYYALGGPEKGIALDASIPIPVDVRVACLSFSSGVVDAASPDEVLRYPRTAQDAWSMVSKFSGIPPLHIDSILWTVGGSIRGLDLNEARRIIAETLMKALPLEVSARVAEELAWRRCP